MEKAEIRADLVVTSVSGTFSTEHLFQTSAGILGVLKLKSSKAKGSFQTADGTVYDFDHAAFLKPNYQLKLDDEVLIRSEKRSTLGRQLKVHVNGKTYLLRPGGGTTRSWTLWDEDEYKVCEIQPKGVFSRGAKILIRQEIEMPLLVFTYCLVIKRWQEESSAG
jgi:hypothetical protein